jgi:hypothetical protein
VSAFQQPKSMAVMFLLGAFLTGGALGFVADRAVTGRPYTRQFDPPSMRDEFARELRLSEQQRRTIDSIFDWRDARAKEARKAIKPVMDSITDSMRVLINAQLDTTQQRLFTELRDSIAVRDSLRRAREGKR